MAVIFGTAFAVEMTYDVASDYVWDSLNKGVCHFLPQHPLPMNNMDAHRLLFLQRQWKDLKVKIAESEQSQQSKSQGLANV